jgi:hypothetical protein
VNRRERVNSTTPPGVLFADIMHEIAGGGRRVATVPPGPALIPLTTLPAVCPALSEALKGSQRPFVAEESWRTLFRGKHAIEHMSGHALFVSLSQWLWVRCRVSTVSPRCAATAVMGAVSARIELAAKCLNEWNTKRSSANPAPTRAGRQAES